MSNADPEEDLSNWPEDRFESHWTGPHDHHAMAYAAEKGISYYTGGGTVIEIGSATGLFEIRIP